MVDLYFAAFWGTAASDNKIEDPKLIEGFGLFERPSIYLEKLKLAFTK